MSADRPAGFHSAAVGEPNVHNDHVRLRARRDIDCFLRRCCFADDDHAFLPAEERAQAFADDLVVIDEHHTDLRLAHLYED